MNMVNVPDDVTITVVPQVGDHIWFTVPHDDDLYGGMVWDGVVSHVDLNRMTVKVKQDSESISDDWYVYFQDKYFTSREAFLENQVEELCQELLQYRRRYGAL